MRSYYENILLGDYHVHSTFSDDADSTLQENVDAAVAAGLTQLRLVDHVRESTSWVPEFVAAVQQLQVPPSLHVAIGVEAKILDAAGALDVPADLSGVDTILIADHQFPGEEGPLSPRRVQELMAEGWNADDVLDTYLSGLVHAMERFPGNQLAHCFSLLPKIGLTEDNFGQDRLNRWAQTAASTGTVVEVNEKWACPNPVALHAAQQAGVTLVAATDSHHKDSVGHYKQVLNALRELEGIS